MSKEISRRGFLRETVILGAAAAALREVDAAAGGETLPGELPKIRLGSLAVSRLILGSNPFFGYAHNGALGRQMVEYYSDDRRIMDVLAQAAELGITAVTALPSPVGSSFSTSIWTAAASFASGSPNLTATRSR